ncbi:MAG: ROK family protein [Erysipelotrichaceae bacterium]|nr:ROK family protein [Erysipelotrichaceae bacterium]
MKTYLCIDVGGTAIKYGLLHEDGTILSTDSIPTPKESIEEFYAVLDEIVHPVSQRISGIALSMPGRINNQTGYIHTGGAISRYMTKVPLGTLLTERYHLPVAIENDGKCAAHAELWLGNLKDVNSGAVIVLGTGIGGGIVLNQKVWRGLHGSAGEFSYLATDYDKSIIQNASWAFTNGVYGLLAPYAQIKNIPIHEINGKVFFEALSNKDEDAQQIFDIYLQRCLNGILTLQSILDVDRYCIGGGISSQDILIEAIEKKVNGFFDAAPDYVALIRPTIRRCAFNNNANLIGALKNFIDIHG